jgi:hypothetical protein
MARTRGVLLLLWPLVLSLVLLAPLRHSGHLLSRDLVFVPREPLTDAAIGLGDAPPRSVPLDTVVAVVTSVLDGAVLGRVLLLLALVLAGWGVLRLTAAFGTTARLAASGFAVWNPFVIERMALGQCALVLAYAALPWVLLAGAAHRRTGARRDFAGAVLWSALASLTPTGGLFALAGVVAGGASRRPRSWVLVIAVAVLQLPWVLPSLVNGASRTSDPAGVSVFAPGSDASGHPALAVLGLGGIWDGLSVPDSRHTPLAVAAIAFVALSALVGVHRWWVAAPDLAPRLAVLGVVGLLLTVVLTTPAGQDLMRHAVTSVPGAGLLRDGQKLLAPFVILVACLFGGAVDVVARALGRHGDEAVVFAGLLLVLIPIGLVPDGGGAVWRTVRPVAFPDSLGRVVSTIDRGPADRALVTLPWRCYRNVDWGTGYPSSDPLVRMVDRPVITSDELAVGDRVVSGESDTAARIGDALATRRPAEALPAYGVGWVVVYADDPDAGRVDVTGLRTVLTSPELTLYAVPGAVAAPEPAAWRRATVVGADLVVLLVLLAAAVVLLQSAQPLPREPR